MIDVYSWPTPNGHKIHIMLEECGQKLGRDWQVHAVNIGAGEQFTPAFLTISPNNKIPALTDTHGPDGKPIALFESGAMMLYLGAKFGKFLGNTDREKFTTLQWLMFQMGGLGPMLGQAHHFRIYAPEKIDYAVERYTNEAKRLYGVLNTQLGKTPFLAGKRYTVADMACFPWARSAANQGIDWADFPHAKRWFDLISARPAVIRAVAVLAEQRKPVAQLSNAEREVLFGKQAIKK
jgi:GSH-dependent disulfide-bond oxidoreductase